MVKRKTPVEKAARKPRKRVAFSAPKDAATKAIIAQNASTSFFLRLPLEIRNKIYSELLGDRLLHLNYTSDDDFAATTPHGRARPSAWRHVVCQADCPESQEDQETSYPDLDGDGEEVLRLRPHTKCDDSVGLLYWDRVTLPLRILRSCRQIYTEANQILWSTNTFSFDEGIAFKCFIGTRTLIQKRALKKLRFQMYWHQGGHKDWNSALNIALIRSLHGLRHFRLSIEYRLASKDYQFTKKNFTGPYRTILKGGLEKIATLPLTHVEISVKDSVCTEEDGYEHVWSEAERTDYAEGIRNLLLNPKGAEIYAQKQIEMKEIHRKQRESEAEIKASLAAYFPLSGRPGAGISDQVTKVDSHSEVA